MYYNFAKIQDNIHKNLLRIHYPKFLLLFITFGIAYLIFYGKTYEPLHGFLISMGYFGTFLAGIFFAYGFTAAPATAIFLILAKEQNILLAGFIGGLGALAGDLIIFKIIRHSFADEIERLSKERITLYLNKRIPNYVKKYFIPFLACSIIASPLPDEIGVSMLATIRTFSVRAFSIISYLLNTTGIFVILVIGRAL